jgi:hypothetical protein
MVPGQKIRVHLGAGIPIMPARSRGSRNKASEKLVAGTRI